MEKMTQNKMNDIFITTLKAIKSVCEKTTSGNVSHNVAIIRCKCVEMLQFFEDWNKHIPSAVDEVLNGIKDLQWEENQTFGLIAKTEVNIYCIEDTKQGVFVYTLLMSDFYEQVSSVEEAKRLANENYRGKIKQILGL